MELYMSSLVKYESPILVLEEDEVEEEEESLESKEAKIPRFSPPLPPEDSNRQSRPVTPTPQFPPARTDEDVVEEIIDCIVPPREYEEEGKKYILALSREPATRMDVLNLQHQLDIYLEQRQARLKGICPIRRELFDQCFDELIRQVTINSVDRGLLLVRVRDELRMTLAAYETLYESSIAYGLRKALETESKEEDTELMIQNLKEETRQLNAESNELRWRCEMAEKTFVEQREANCRRHEERMNFLKKSNTQLTNQLNYLLKQ